MRMRTMKRVACAAALLAGAVMAGAAAHAAPVAPAPCKVVGCETVGGTDGLLTEVGSRYGSKSRYRPRAGHHRWGGRWDRGYHRYGTLPRGGFGYRPFYNPYYSSAYGYPYSGLYGYDPYDYGYEGDGYSIWSQRDPEVGLESGRGDSAYLGYCARKYRSFDPDTGKYRTYSGRYRTCVYPG